MKSQRKRLSKLFPALARSKASQNLAKETGLHGFFTVIHSDPCVLQ